MHRIFLLAVLAPLLLVWPAQAQDLCPQTLVHEDRLIFIQGSFVNREASRIHADIAWRCHPASADTFMISVPGKDSLVFITDGTSRTLEKPREKSRRKLATHHLKERILGTPLKFDDLDLLANGQFLCPDSNSRPNSFATAFSQTWYHLRADQIPDAKTFRMSGAKGEVRNIEIAEWKTFDGIRLPTAIKFKTQRELGTVWLRSVHQTAQGPHKDPLIQQIAKESEPADELNLDNKLLREVPVIKAIFGPGVKPAEKGELLTPLAP